jgi:hypothetical protein
MTEIKTDYPRSKWAKGQRLTIGATHFPGGWCVKGKITGDDDIHILASAQGSEDAVQALRDLLTTHGFKKVDESRPAGVRKAGIDFKWREGFEVWAKA